MGERDTWEGLLDADPGFRVGEEGGAALAAGELARDGLALEGAAIDGGRHLPRVHEEAEERVPSGRGLFLGDIDHEGLAEIFPGERGLDALALDPFHVGRARIARG